MTPLPRSPAAPAAPPRSKLGFPPWHVLCISLGASGCFYFGPVPYEPEDEPPEVISSSFPEDGDNVIDLTYDAQHTTATLFVAALDPEGGDVVFVWSWGDGTSINTDVSTAERSYYELELDEDLDGEHINCVVSDLSANTVTLSAELGINRSAVVDGEAG